MKNSIFYYLLVLLIVASCKEQPKETKVVTTTVEDPTPESPTFNPNCYFSEQIHSDTAEIWFNSWCYSASYLSEVTISESPEIHFTGENVMKLRPEGLTENKGVLIYYILEYPVDPLNDKGFNFPIPSLAMIATDQCISSLGTCDDYCALVSWYKGDQVFITQEEIARGLLNQYRDNWVNYLKDITEAEIKVEGYNYSWTMLDHLLKEDNEEIVLKYGIRTLGPEEHKQFLREGEEAEDKAVGIPVLCNVIVGKKFNDETADALAAAEEFDFAKPCPAYCAQ